MLQSISEYHQLADPLRYPMLFPMGDDGFHLGMLQKHKSEAIIKFPTAKWSDISDATTTYVLPQPSQGEPSISPDDQDQLDYDGGPQEMQSYLMDSLTATTATTTTATQSHSLLPPWRQTAVLSNPASNQQTSPMMMMILTMSLAVKFRPAPVWSHACSMM